MHWGLSLRLLLTITVISSIGSDAPQVCSSPTIVSTETWEWKQKRSYAGNAQAWDLILHAAAAMQAITLKRASSRFASNGINVKLGSAGAAGRYSSDMLAPTAAARGLDPAGAVQRRLAAGWRPQHVSIFLQNGFEHCQSSASSLLLRQHEET